MTMRRNVISLLIWLSIVAIFTIHLIITHRNDETKHNAINERSITQVKTTILKTTELENIKINNKEHNGEQIEEQNTNEKEGDEANLDKNNDLIDKAHDGETRYTTKIQLDYDMLCNEIETLKATNIRLLEREKQFKTLARKLATKLKSKEGKGVLPKLDPALPWVFAITPTYARYTQKADLIRLSQTLMHVTNLHWIIVEDSHSRTDLVGHVLQESGLSYTHLNKKTPSSMQRKRGEKYNKHHRGVSQRNLAIKWLRDNVNIKKTPGAVYFMDDDNTYHRKIFDEMRWTRRVATWPIGLAGGLRWSGALVSNGKVVNFRNGWALDRVFPIDMAGFAVSLTVFLEKKPNAQFDETAKRGYLETTFLESITTINELEPKADNCTKVLVWHTRTADVPKSYIKSEREYIKNGTNLGPPMES